MVEYPAFGNARTSLTDPGFSDIAKIPISITSSGFPQNATHARPRATATNSGLTLSNGSRGDTRSVERDVRDPWCVSTRYSPGNTRSANLTNNPELRCVGRMNVRQWVPIQGHGAASAIAQHESIRPNLFLRRIFLGQEGRNGSRRPCGPETVTSIGSTPGKPDGTNLSEPDTA